MSLQYGFIFPLFSFPFMSSCGSGLCMKISSKTFCEMHTPFCEVGCKPPWSLRFANVSSLVLGGGAGVQTLMVALMDLH